MCTTRASVTSSSPERATRTMWPSATSTSSSRGAPYPVVQTFPPMNAVRLPGMGHSAHPCTLLIKRDQQHVCKLSHEVLDVSRTTARAAWTSGARGSAPGTTRSPRSWSERRGRPNRTDRGCQAWPPSARARAPRSGCGTPHLAWPRRPPRGRTRQHGRGMTHRCPRPSCSG